jgi:hypothetical protein
VAGIDVSSGSDLLEREGGDLLSESAGGRDRVGETLVDATRAALAVLGEPAQTESVWGCAPPKVLNLPGCAAEVCSRLPEPPAPEVRVCERVCGGVRGMGAVLRLPGRGKP